MFNLQFKRVVSSIITLSLTFATLFAPLSYIKAAASRDMSKNS
jgi:hypothetical protein